MKKLIAELRILTAPKEKEELVIYLAAAKEAISAVLMTKRDGKQMPIYFVSRALQDPKVNYTPMEKLILALMLSNLEVTGRLLKWRFELEEHDIHYRPRTSVKGQILADFIMERPEDDSPDTPIKDKEELLDPNPEGIEFTYAIRFRFDATDNEAEYEALIVGLRIAEQMGIKNLQAYVDSRLMANQVNGTYIAKEPGMIKYLEKVKNLTNTFKEFSIKQVPKGENKKADALSKMASTSFGHISKQVLVEELKENSIRVDMHTTQSDVPTTKMHMLCCTICITHVILWCAHHVVWCAYHLPKLIDEKEVLAVVEKEGCTWMTPIYEYLKEEILPEEKRKARAIRCKTGNVKPT
uniref:Reverse transcriptase domain-containing protein n=1 Tax=Tanacetum cinerariifolium TaxID=118510 RepID=A0A699KK29_TANCI|nr:reverse transcriptase domain-containing protein [Tanacetum cinerariifolium]